MKSFLVSAFFAALLCITSLHGQQIKIVVVEARHGKPIKDECLNISLGTWHGALLLAPTNKDGIVILSFENNQMSVASSPENRCNRYSSASSVQVDALPTIISPMTDWYVSCQYSKKLIKDPVWLQSTPDRRIPSFNVHEILTNGANAVNSCSRLTLVPKPGELILYVRKRTLLEGMKS